MATTRVPNLNRPPILIPRWVLTLMYSCFAVLGMLGLVFGSPTFSLANVEGYTGVWGAAVFITGTIAAYGSHTTRRERLERWGNFAMVLGLVFYAANAIFVIVLGIDPTASRRRAIFTGMVVLLLIIPLVRGWQLLGRSGFAWGRR